MKKETILVSVLALLGLFGHGRMLFAQGYGTDTQNVLMPASGGMAGVSLAAPQDVPSAVFGNPSTLTQFDGTQFTLGGGWVEGYPTVTRFGFADPADNFSVTSGTEGFLIPNIGVVQDLRPLGLPGAIGFGLAGLSGLGAEYRGKAPVGSIANDFSTEYLVLGLNAGAAFQLGERLSVGASMTLGTGFEQLGLVQSTAMVHDYALRGTVGLDYDLNECNTLAAFYQTKMGFQFPNAFRNPLNDTYSNINVDQPETIGFGIANRRFCNGNLLIGADVYYKLWENADFYRDIFVNQWAFAVGTQLTRGKMKYRLGYSYNTNPVNHNVGSSLDGKPVLQDQIQFLQASETAVINQHRITAGVGRSDLLFRGLDLDLFVGGLPKTSDQFGDNTEASVALYYLGMGLTWRYGACPSRECCCIEQQ
jgi:long-chain fatty acid transport protein